MEAFMLDIFETYRLPDMPSYRQAIASLIMHLGPTTSKMSRKYFAISVKKAMANQVAYEVIDAIRAADKKAAEEKATKEVTLHDSKKVKALKPKADGPSIA